MRARRFYGFTDAITSVEKTPAGGRRLKGRISRSGVFVYEYVDEKGNVTKVREWRPPNEVLASAPSYLHAAVTDLHPPEMVSPINFASVAKGHISAVDTDEFSILSALDVNDAALISRVDDGSRKEISSGYYADFDPTPGRVPAGMPDEGEEYDGIQCNMVGNHAALGPSGWGRQGPSVGLFDGVRGNHLNGCPGSAIRLDMADATAPKRTHKVGQFTFDAGGDQHIAAIDTVIGEKDTEIGKLRAEVVTAKADAATATARAEKSDAAANPKAIALAVAKRVDLIAMARTVKEAKARKIADSDQRATAIKAARNYLAKADDAAGTPDDAIMADILTSAGVDPTGMTHEMMLGALKALFAKTAAEEATETEAEPSMMGAGPPVNPNDPTKQAPPAADALGTYRSTFDPDTRTRGDGATDEDEKRRTDARDKRKNMHRSHVKTA